MSENLTSDGYPRCEDTLTVEEEAVRCDGRTYHDPEKQHHGYASNGLYVAWSRTDQVTE